MPCLDIMRNQKYFMILAFNFTSLFTVVTALRDYKADWIIYALNWMTQLYSRAFTDMPSTLPGWEAFFSWTRKKKHFHFKINESF